jgi:hypothetical protein
MDAGSAKVKREVARRKQLERDLSKAKRKLRRTRAELESAQAWIDELELRMRRIQRSPPYRFASRFWRLKARIRAPLRRREGEPAGPSKAASDSESWIPAGVPDGRQDAEPQPPPSAGVSRAVTLLGLPSDQELTETLEELDRQGLADSELLVITDSDALRSLDQFHCRYEYIPPREDWETLGRDASEYEDFLRRRLEMIGAQHGVAVDEALAAPGN